MHPLEPTFWTIGFSTSALFLTLWRNQVVAQKRATVDLIVDQKKNPKLLAANKKLMALVEKKIALTDFCSKGQSAEYDAIMTALNNLEFISCGVRSGVYHEGVYKRLRYTSVMKSWELLRGFVYQERTNVGSKTLFQDFEWLAKRWDRKPLKAE